MTAIIQTLVPYGVLAMQVLLVLLLLAGIFRDSWGKRLFTLFGTHSLLLAFLVALSALVGSLFYSEVVGFEACVLCWWQRIFLYPTVIIFGLALIKKTPLAFFYSLPLVVLAGVTALYHAYSNWSGQSLLPCTGEAGDCSRLYVDAFGFITIPAMSLTIVLLLLALAWLNKLYANENSNS
jgi:disulfide bond formation protein DsbB